MAETAKLLHEWTVGVDEYRLVLALQNKGEKGEYFHIECLELDRLGAVRWEDACLKPEEMFEILAIAVKELAGKKGLPSNFNPLDVLMAHEQVADDVQVLLHRWNMFKELQVGHLVFIRPFPTPKDYTPEDHVYEVLNINIAEKSFKIALKDGTLETCFPRQIEGVNPKNGFPMRHPWSYEAANET